MPDIERDPTNQIRKGRQPGQAGTDEMWEIDIRASQPKATIKIIKSIADFPERRYVCININKRMFVYDPQNKEFEFTPNKYSSTRSMTFNEIGQFKMLANENLAGSADANNEKILANMSKSADNPGRVDLNAYHKETSPDRLYLELRGSVRVAYDKQSGEVEIMEYKTSVPGRLSESQPLPVEGPDGITSHMYQTIKVANTKGIKVSRWQNITDGNRLKNYKSMIKTELMQLKLDPNDPRAELVESLIEKL